MVSVDVWTVKDPHEKAAQTKGKSSVLFISENKLCRWAVVRDVNVPRALAPVWILQHGYNCDFVVLGIQTAA